MNFSTILSLIAIGLAALKATGHVDPEIMGYIDTAINAINKATLAIQQAKLNVDPTALKQIDLVP